MSLLIDGYNLLFIAGFVTRGVGPGTLERSRCALLSFVAEVVEPDQRARTTVVFDAKDPPPGLPKTFQYLGITVWFSTDFEDADELIEQLIRLDSAPRSLTVVSSDHRLQRAARRRRATPVDSDRWFSAIVAQRRMEDRVAQARAELSKPAAPSTAEEVQHWLEIFGGIDEQVLAREVAAEGVAESGSLEPSAQPSELQGESPGRTPAKEGVELPENPFPPGYGEDLLRELKQEGLWVEDEGQA